MVGELITLPLRVGIRASQLWLRVATETVAVAANATGRLIDEVVSRPRAESFGDADAQAELAQGRPAARGRVETPTQVETPSRYDAPAESEPIHVSEDPELVETVAEAVIDRLAGASSAELAAIRLYESERKGRVTVLEAVDRELRISSGSGSQS
jgi:hypothetical protein